MNVLRSVKNPSRFPAGGTENRPGRKPGKTRGRELRTGPLRSPPYVPYGTRQFPYSHIPAEPAGPYLSVRSGWPQCRRVRQFPPRRGFPLLSDLPAESSPAEGFRLRHSVRYHAPGSPRCPRLPRDARAVPAHEASRGRTHSLPLRVCPTCLRKIPGSLRILACSCRLTLFRRPDENSARQTGGLSAPARDARL